MVSPVIGQSAAARLAALYLPNGNTGEELRGKITKLGSIAAFFLGEYDDGTMPLTTEDWEEIRNTLEDESEKMNLDTLTELMGQLLSRGLL
jgi:hypothetical protein